VQLVDTLETNCAQSDDKGTVREETTVPRLLLLQVGSQTGRQAGRQSGGGGSGEKETSVVISENRN